MIRLTDARMFEYPKEKRSGRAAFALSPHGSQAAYFRVRTGAGGGASPALHANANGLLWDRANHLDLLTRAATKDGEVWRWRRASEGMRLLDTFVFLKSELSTDDEIDVISGVLDY
ncbi:hypothetical protein [Nonomuraea rosea]|uniref:hypothetical protein n=1 Tax=Nonomuraea rosea TaxID=638574 RepID=UPI0031EEBF20